MELGNSRCADVVPWCLKMRMVEEVRGPNAVDHSIPLGNLKALDQAQVVNVHSWADEGIWRTVSKFSRFRRHKTTGIEPPLHSSFSPWQVPLADPIRKPAEGVCIGGIRAG